jgi:hypothetical protein
MARRVHGDVAPLPMFTRAMTQLLGAPGLRCVHLMRGMAKGRVDSGRARRGTAGQGRRAGLITATRGVPLHTARDWRKPCGICTVARNALRAGVQSGLTASAAAAQASVVTPALVQHVRTLVPPVPATHNGKGRMAECNCLDCRAARRQRYMDAGR